jgi:hypothetical protein
VYLPLCLWYIGEWKAGAPVAVEELALNITSRSCYKVSELILVFLL